MVIPSWSGFNRKPKGTPRFLGGAPLKRHPQLAPRFRECLGAAFEAYPYLSKQLPGGKRASVMNIADHSEGASLFGGYPFSRNPLRISG